MGKIKVHGYAEQEINCDLVKLTITFRAKEKNSARAAMETLNLCDGFLTSLKKRGIKPEELHLEADSINQSYMDRQETALKAVRKIQFTVPFQMDFLNSILEQIQKQAGNIEYSTEFCLSDPEKVHKQLLTKAVLDAKKKAEIVAEALGQKVIALKSAEPLRNGQLNQVLDYLTLECDEDDDFCEEQHISSHLQAPVSKESEIVETIWIIE